MELFRLIWINLTVTVWSLQQYLREAWRYYGKASFRRVDIALLRQYIFHNPYRISKRFLMQLGESEIYAYGETPLTTLELMTRECKVTAADKVFELGCGRGRACFWLRLWLGCEVVGIEFVPAFVHTAKKIQEEYEVGGLEFRLEDLLASDFSGATVIYLYGTCYDEDFIRVVIEKCKKLPAGTRIISVSYSLEEFGAEEFAVQRIFPASFIWGVGDVYLQVRK